MLNEQLFLGAAPAVGFGAIERRNPLPAGRYWVDVFDPDIAAWTAWRTRNGQNVKVEETEHFEGDPSRDFIIFKVLAPVPWEGPGLPTIAEPSVQTSSDTGQRPAPEPDPTTKIGDWIDDNLWGSHPVATAVGSGILVIAGGALLVYVISKTTRKQDR